MLYFNTKYEGIKNEFSSYNKQSMTSEAEKVFIIMPTFETKNLYSYDYVSFDIQACTISISSILDLLLPQSALPKTRIQSLLDFEKLNDPIVPLVNIEDLFDDFWIFFDNCEPNTSTDQHLLKFEYQFENNYKKEPYKGPDFFGSKQEFFSEVKNSENCIEDNSYSVIDLELLTKTIELHKIEIKIFEVYDNRLREVFDMSFDTKELIVDIKDIRLKRKTQEVQVSRQKPMKVIKATSRPSLTVIESIEDLKKFNSSSENTKKLVRFASDPHKNVFTVQDHLTQINKIPLKLFTNKQNPLVSKIVDLLSLEDCYIVSLEFTSAQMDGMDLILTWQTGVKLCPVAVISSKPSTLSFLQSFQEHIKKFDLVILIFITEEHKDFEGLRVLEEYMKFLEEFSIKFRFVVLKNVYEAKAAIEEYLKRYIKSIDDTKTWVFLQEKISDETFEEFSDSVNIYSSNIMKIAQTASHNDFNVYCNCLGTNKTKYDRLSALLSKM